MLSTLCRHIALMHSSTNSTVPNVCMISVAEYHQDNVSSSHLALTATLLKNLIDVFTCFIRFSFSDIL